MLNQTMEIDCNQSQFQLYLQLNDFLKPEEKIIKY